MRQATQFQKEEVQKLTSTDEPQTDRPEEQNGDSTVKTTAAQSIPQNEGPSKQVVSDVGGKVQKKRKVGKVVGPEDEPEGTTKRKPTSGPKKAKAIKLSFGEDEEVQRPA